MRDPLDKRIRPYDILQLSPDATLAEVNAAYTRLCADRANFRRRQEITDAWQRLRRVQTRLEEDVWYYQVPLPAQAQFEGEAPSGPPVIEPQLPPITLGRELTDLHQGRAARLQTPIRFRQVELSYISRYYDAPIRPDHVSFDS